MSLPRAKSPLSAHGGDFALHSVLEGALLLGVKGEDQSPPGTRFREGFLVPEVRFDTNTHEEDDLEVAVISYG